jgi:hypothetical protein
VFDDPGAENWPRFVAAFAAAGSRAHTVLADGAVRDAWSDASILREMSVGAVAGHLLAALRMFERRYDLPVPTGARPVEPTTGFATVRLRRLADLDQPPFRVPRENGHRLAERGHTTVVEQFATSLARLVGRLRDDDPARPIAGADDTTHSTLRAYTVTRVVELVIHGDDLAESVGVAIDPPTSDAAGVVIEFLFASVRHRLGDALVIRALAGRADPDDLRAL